MKRIISRIWHWFGGIKLTVAVLLLMVVITAVGYLSLNRRASIFQPLNDVGLLQWTRTYALNNPAVTAWLFLLLLLLAVLTVNTFVCTTNRVAALMRFRSRFKPGRFFLKLSPHIMHYAVIVILIGYLCSYLFSDVQPSRTLTVGSPVDIPGMGLSLNLDSVDVRFYEGERLESFNNRAIDVAARLSISDGTDEWKKTIGINRPIWFGSYGVFLKNFSPKYKMAMTPRTYIEITVRRDPGIFFYFPGMILFVLGLIMYLYQRLFLKGDETHEC